MSARSTAVPVWLLAWRSMPGPPQRHDRDRAQLRRALGHSGPVRARVCAESPAAAAQGREAAKLFARGTARAGAHCTCALPRPARDHMTICASGALRRRGIGALLIRGATAKQSQSSADRAWIVRCDALRIAGCTTPGPNKRPHLKYRYNRSTTGLLQLRSLTPKAPDLKGGRLDGARSRLTFARHGASCPPRHLCQPGASMTRCEETTRTVWRSKQVATFGDHEEATLKM
eukprot:354474-Chlamydomonas_euryale.AAC.1